MDNENAFLPHFLDEEIYIIDAPKSVKPVEKSMVNEPETVYETPRVEEEKVSLNYQGKNSKSTLLIVENIDGEEKVFLEKVLGAIKLTIEDCALLQLSENDSEQHHKLIEEFNSEIVVSFGGSLNFMKNINSYKITFVEDKKILKADKLTSIMSDVHKKKELWGCLQQLFS